MESLLVSLNHLDEVWREQGPFEGVLGMIRDRHVYAVSISFLSVPLSYNGNILCFTDCALFGCHQGFLWVGLLQCSSAAFLRDLLA